MRLPHRMLLLTWACLLQAGVAAAAFAAAPASAQAKPASTPSVAVAASADAGQLLQDAVASVVVVALTEQFDGRVISVKIDGYDVAISSARERLVSGRGTVEMDAKGKDAVSFTYRTLYDVVDAHAGYPTITVNGFTGAGERMVPNDATLVGELDERVVSALSKELQGKPVWLQLDRIESYESGKRYVRINASGLADFGVEGRTPARVEALYDRNESAWLRVNYALGGASPSMAGLQSGH